MEELARVYARALFEVATQRGTIDTVREQLAAFAEALQDNRELSVFFFSPYFSTKEKQDGLEGILDGAEPIFLSFLKLLAEKHRMPVIFRIRRAYERLWEDVHGVLRVQITSAVALDEQTARGVGQSIGERTGRTIELSTRVDPDILGGIVVRVGNSILDASIRNRLEQLRRQVAQAATA